MTIGRRRRGHPMRWGVSGPPGPPAPPGPPEIPVNAVNFDGTNDFLQRSAGLTGAVDKKQLTISFWIKTGVNGGTRVVLLNVIPTNATRFQVRLLTSNLLQIQGINAAVADVWNATSTRTILVADGWVHVLASLDTATGVRSMYIDDVLETFSAETFVADGIIQFATSITDWRVGAGTTGTQKFNGDMAELWFDTNVIDLSILANRRKFISAAGKPVDLGADGSGPTGAAPLVYQSGPTVSWHTNKGTGGGFTEIGALVDAATSPSD